MPVTIDETAWPIVVLRWSGSATDDELDAFLARMDVWLARETRFGVLVDARGAASLSSAQRDRAIDHMRRNREHTRRTLTQAVVVDNVAIRTLYYVMDWMFPMPFVTRSFTDVDAARQWLDAHVLPSAPVLF